ncbi:MAG TPA: hypothetical protein PK478_00745 [Nitrospira sp.]|nr:hypothetical protein [Nitrospira sp.]
MANLELPEMGSTSDLLAEWAIHRIRKPDTPPDYAAHIDHLRIEMDAWAAKDAALKLVIGDAMAEKTVASIIERLKAEGLR